MALAACSALPATTAVPVEQIQLAEPTPISAAAVEPTDAAVSPTEATVAEQAPTEIAKSELVQPAPTSAPASSSEAGGGSQLPSLEEEDTAGPQFEDSGLYVPSDTSQIAATGKFQFLNFYAD